MNHGLRGGRVGGGVPLAGDSKLFTHTPYAWGQGGARGVGSTFPS